VPEIDDRLHRSLPADVRRRLVQFLQQLDRLRVEDLPMFATRPLDQAGYDESVTAATRAAFDSGRRAMLDEMHRSADRWLDQRYFGRFFQPEWAGLSAGTGTALDQAHLHRSLHDAISALVLWDFLDDVYRGHLIGTWSALMEDEAA
jgi:hypothetical protein